MKLPVDRTRPNVKRSASALVVNLRDETRFGTRAKCDGFRGYLRVSVRARKTRPDYKTEITGTGNSPEWRWNAAAILPLWIAVVYQGLRRKGP